MQESADRESSKKRGDYEQEAAGADSEATSKELLSEIEETEENPGAKTSDDPGPSPDGAFDESDEKKDAG
jgi:hypothetical protein